MRVMWTDRIDTSGRIPMRPAGLAFLLVAAMVVMALAACSSDDDAVSETTTEGASTSEFVGFDTDEAVDVEAAASDGARAEAGFAPSAPGAPADLLGRSIARTGGVELRVESVARAFDEVRDRAVARGGFVAESWFAGRDDDAQASLVVRVPTGNVDALLADLRGIAVEVGSIRTGSQDLTTQVVDVEARLRNLRAVELRYGELLGEARNIAEILQVQDRLDGVRTEIERLTAQRETLSNITELATITVELTTVGEPLAVAEPGSGPKQAATDAWDASIDTLSVLLTGIVSVVVYSWWLLPLVPVGWWAVRVMRRREVGPFSAALPAATSAVTPAATSATGPVGVDGTSADAP